MELASAHSVVLLPGALQADQSNNCVHVHDNKLKLDFPIPPFVIPLFRSPKVGLYRLTSVGSRLLFFPLFQTLTRGLFQVTSGSTSVAYGAFLLIGADLGVQGFGIWRRTRSHTHL